MHAANFLDAIEIGQRPRYAQYAVIAARRQAHGISPAVDAEIKAEIARRSDSETGGILFGRYCDVTESFHVVGSLPAPLDSKFSADEFVLGTEGLRPVLTNLIEGSGGALYPLGTWHNHHIPSGPSLKDMGTAVLLSGMQFFPLLMLIHTPAGYHALSVETLSGMPSVTAQEPAQDSVDSGQYDAEIS
jgi:hypothetical protein